MPSRPRPVRPSFWHLQAGRGGPPGGEQSPSCSQEAGGSELAAPREGPSPSPLGMAPYPQPGPARLLARPGACEDACRQPRAVAHPPAVILRKLVENVLLWSQEETEDGGFEVRDAGRTGQKRGRRRRARPAPPGWRAAVQTKMGGRGSGGAAPGSRRPSSSLSELPGEGCGTQSRS